MLFGPSTATDTAYISVTTRFATWPVSKPVARFETGRPDSKLQCITGPFWNGLAGFVTAQSASPGLCSLVLLKERNASNLADFCSRQASAVNQTVSSVSGQSWELGTLATRMRTSWGYSIEEHDLTFKLGQPVSPAVNQLNPQSNIVHPVVKQVDPSNQPSPNSWKARPSF